MNLFLAFDYAQAERVIKRHSKTFYRAFSRLPSLTQRRGIYAVYAYCRTVDDTIDVHQDLKKLHHIKSQLDAFIHDRVPSGFLWRVLADTTKRFNYQPDDFKPFYELIEGQEFDAQPVSVQTMEQLFHYCDLVATSVGRMLMPMLVSNRTEAHDAFAVALGRAFQLTNICRDVGEDQQRNRIYLPKHLLDQFGYTRDALWHHQNNDAFKHVMKHMHHEARTLYAQAEKGLHLFPKEVRFPLHASLVLYRAILDEIETHDFDVFTRKHFVPKETKKRLIDALIKAPS